MSGPSNKQETISFRCVDFTVSSYKQEEFIITIYGIDENRRTYCAKIDNFKPFFYIKVGNNWSDSDVSEYFDHIRETYKSDYSLLKTLKNDLEEVKLVRHKTLYNFDANKKHNFIKVTCKNMSLFYKFKSLFYDKEKQRLNKGLEFNGTYTQLYEIMIPPMLRFFHIQDISPSGWIEIRDYDLVEDDEKETKVDVEIKVNCTDIISLPEKETIVPYKICSFDIEASSSHGDFPTAIKNYKKVAYDILDYIQLNGDEVLEYGMEKLLYYLLKSVFGFADDISIDNCYVKNKKYNETNFEKEFNKFIPDSIILNDEHAAAFVANTMDDYISAFDGGYDAVGLEQSEADICETGGIRKTKKKSNIKHKKNNTTTIASILNDTNYDNQTKMGYLTISLNNHFPHLEGDYVTFIGSTFVSYGQENSNLNHCICLGETTNHDEDTQVIECYDTEREVLLAWTDLIREEDPDIMIGYNIFGFDYPFMFDRAKENNCTEEFMNLSRRNETFLEDEELKLSQTKIVLASGAYDLKYPPMDGRLQIDVFAYMRKEFILPSYKLDYVSSYLISDKVSKYENNEKTCSVFTKNTKGISMNCFVHFEILNHSNELYQNGKKFKVVDVNDDGFVVDGNLEDIENQTIQWGLAKDDVTPQDIFRMTNEGPKEKGIIAKYCIQDCNLVHQIFQKVDIMTTYIEMSKICSVPISFLMLRGQGVKLTSYVAKKCREKDTLMPLISIGNASDLYEGAIVLEPKTGLYLDNPVACVDYSSLYPSSIISENISHDSKVWTKTYNLNNTLLYQTGIVDKSGKFKYDNLSSYKYVDIKYDTFAFKRLNGISSKLSKVLTGYKICRYAQFPDNGRAILPSILQELLSARKATKKQMGKESDPFMKNILDKRQLSIKVTANSLYGQCGAKTSTFYEMDIAASTTATGRKLLIYAKDIIERVYNNIILDTTHGNMKINAEYIYGDTDSVFFTFNLKDPTTNKDVRGKKALEVTIDLAKEVGKLATKYLKAPHDLEYEKTFMPFCLISKKRYVGMLYEEDPDKCKRKSMGIVLKRRDNAPIVKDVYGGIIDILMKEKNINKSIDFLDNMLNKIVNEEIGMDKLIISKSLRSFYKCPHQIAHKVLADRIGLRQPGNKPRAGDRIPYVFIYSKNKKELQGNKIELPDYIKEKNLKIDYGFYITNQIMKPVIQIYSLVLFDMPQFQKKSKMFAQKINTLMENSDDEEKALRKIQSLKDKEVETLLFKKYITINNNKAQNNRMITDFFG
jgi:DNA polymerase elongation subunit (family B)